MKPLLIIKAGSTVPSVRERRGDFEKWILEAMEWDPREAKVVSVYLEEELPEPTEISAVVVTGSGAMVSAKEAWSEQTTAWLKTCVEQQICTLGICYGHQLLAHALGALVGKNPNGLEIGSIEVQTTDAAKHDLLFSGMPKRLRFQATHQESVLELPSGATLLAKNTLDGHQAFRIGAKIWGVQFHPEFDADVIKGYVSERRDRILSYRLDPDAIAKAINDSPHGSELLRNFASIVRKQS